MQGTVLCGIENNAEESEVDFAFKELTMRRSFIKKFKRNCLSSFGLLEQKCHRLAGLNSKHVFLAVLEAGKFETKALADSTCHKALLPGFLAHSPHLLAVLSQGGRVERALWSLFS